METWTIHKPAVSSTGGIVSAQNREAAEAGARVLAAGGNAIDAAVVTALVCRRSSRGSPGSAAAAS